MSTTVTMLRISYVWFAGSADALARPAGTAGLLARPTTYQDLFGQAQREVAGAPFLAPWFRPRGQRFWRRYLEGHWPRDVGLVTAWRNITPLRLPSVTLSDGPVDAKVSLDRYVYAHGVGAVLEATWYEAKLALPDAVRTGISLRADVGRSGDANSRGLSLDDVIELVAETDRKTLFSSASSLTAVPSDPVSICTVIRAEGDASLPVQGDDVHRAVHGLATWSPLWKDVDLPELSTATVAGGNGSPRIVYGTRRSRVIWYPAAFSREDPTLHALACYHRNLALATLQADALAAMTVYGEQLWAGGSPLGGDAYDIVRLAATALGRFYGGADATYRSKSVPRQIDDHERRPEVDALIARMNLPPLTRRGPA